MNYCCKSLLSFIGKPKRQRTDKDKVWDSRTEKIDVRRCRLNVFRSRALVLLLAKDITCVRATDKQKYSFGRMQPFLLRDSCRCCSKYSSAKGKKSNLDENRCLSDSSQWTNVEKNTWSDIFIQLPFSVKSQVLRRSLVFQSACSTVWMVDAL